MSIGTSGHPPGLDDAVVAAYGAGRPVPEIADQHRISSDAVYEIVHRATAEPAPAPPAPPAAALPAPPAALPAPAAPARFCSACGSALPAGSGFCPQCGNAVAAKPRPVALWVVLAAGAVAIGGPFLPWVTVSAPLIGTISKSGIDVSDGWVSAGLGALLVAYAAVRLRPHPLPAVVTAFAGLVTLLVIGVGIVEFVDLKNKIDEARSTMTDRDDPFGIGNAVSAATRITPGAGLWLVTAAGLVGLAALLIAAVNGGAPARLVGAAGAAALMLLAGEVTAAVLVVRDQAPHPASSTAKGVTATTASPLIIDLADGHLLKLAFTVQFTADVTAEPDLGAAEAAADALYRGVPIGTLETEGGREQLKSDFLARLKDAYPGTVLDVYYTQFVTQ